MSWCMYNRLEGVSHIIVYIRGIYMLEGVITTRSVAMMLTRKVWSALCLRMEPKTRRLTAVAGLMGGPGVTPSG